ncbi:MULTISPECIES: hypothetical protein [unclassified Streptomyces]|uniref:hypothetical protein n=1 Tax=Streptomyces sp. NPDC055082 TaxID=3365718 RepID=UPI0037D7270C
MTALVAVSMTETVPPTYLAAQARAPSALTITVVGIEPTATATATDATVARSMTRTVSAPWSATYACAPVELMAMSKRRSRPGT